MVACKWEDTSTENIAAYVVNVQDTDMRNIPTNPGDQYRVPVDARVTASLVTALREMLLRGQG
jgi:hypothetical protein